MALDGIFVHSLVKELSMVLAGGRIEKIYQPEGDEMIITIRSKGESVRLLLSASSSNPRAHIVKNAAKENPETPPMFCMLSRKNLLGGRILSVTQPDFERIIKISVETLDELKQKRNIDILIEIMGKHSNIILVDSGTNKILDSIKRIPLSVSSYRQILPGNSYTAPPPQDKLNPLELVDKEEFTSKISNSNSPVFKAIYESFKGISPIVAKEIVHRSSLPFDIHSSLLESRQLDVLFESFDRFFRQIRNDIFSPSIVIDKTTDTLVDFCFTRLTLYSSLSYIESESPSEILETFYMQRDLKERMKQKTINLRKSMSNKLERLQNKVQKQREELLESENAAIYKLYGDLITSYIYMIKPGMESVSVANFFVEDAPLVDIPLEKNRTPSQNAQKYFKKYTKLKTAALELEKQIAITLKEIDYLENIIYSIENCESAFELDEIVEELVKEGLVKSRLKSKSKKKESEKSKVSKPLSFYSSDGLEILVGKNNKQNDVLTLKTAAPSDIWLHTKDIPGSHVIIRTGGKKASDTAIAEAAKLAAYHSKARMSANVPVDYTERKNVKKPSGAKPGMVIYESNRTIYVTPSEEDLVAIKKNSPSPDSDANS